MRLPASAVTAKRVSEWLPKPGVQMLFIDKGSPWENGCVESFNGKTREELLALVYRPPAPQILIPLEMPTTKIGGRPTYEVLHLMVETRRIIYWCMAASRS